MANMSLKEKVFYGFICNENRVYKHWYTRFLLSGLDLERIRRVVSRIPKWRNWCAEWYEEGCRLEQMAHAAEAEGKNECARRLVRQGMG